MGGTVAKGVLGEGLKINIAICNVSLETTNEMVNWNVQIPEDIIREIFSMLPKVTLATASKTCKSWRKIIFSLDSEFTSFRVRGITRYKNSHSASNNLTTKTLDLKRFGQQLATNNFWRAVHINTNLVTPSNIDFLGPALAANSTLCHLDLSDNDLGRSIVNLFDALGKNSTIKYLNISKTGITDKALEAAKSSISRNECLTYLDISYNQFQTDGYLALAEALCAMCDKRQENKVPNLLRELKCKGNRSGTPEKWLPTLLSCGSLTHLSLGRVVEYGDGKRFADALAAHTPLLTNLHTLKIQRNHLCEHGETVLLALSKNTTLTNINLNWNFMGDGNIPAVPRCDGPMEQQRFEAQRAALKLRRKQSGLGTILRDLLTSNQNLRVFCFRGNHLAKFELKELALLKEQCWYRLDLKLDPQVEKINH